MKKIYINVFLYSLVLFSLYSAIIIGIGWDESTTIQMGKLRLKYFFSLGLQDYQSDPFSFYIRLYPGTYSVVVMFITQLFPKNFEIETLHILNTFIGISTIFGVSKIARELFNKKIGYIVFIISFFNPIFFGHMAISTRDIIWAFCNVWMSYSLIKYFKYHHLENKKKRFVIFIGLLFGLGLSVRVSFFVTIIPIFIFLLIDSFYQRKICKKKILINRFIKDILISIFIAYVILIICWPEVYPNILILPFQFFYESFNFSFGVPKGLINGVVFDTANPPANYILIFLFYKLPEYLILSYFLFLIISTAKSIYFKEVFNNFYYKILLIIFIITFPNLILLVSPYSIYDNLRLFLYLIPYLSILPGIIIFYLLENMKYKINKILSVLLSILFIYSLYNFFSLTPYQYTYLNSFSGKFSETDKKFESDYFSTSIIELLKKTQFEKDKHKKIALCGLGKGHIKYVLKKYKFKNITIVPLEDNYDYIMMTNRVYVDPNKDDFKTCYEEFTGTTISSVERMGLNLSLIRRKNI